MTLLILFLVLFVIWLIGTLNVGANWGGLHVNWLDGWTRIICRFLHRLPKQYIDLPETGPAIVVANHVSGLDPLLLVSASHRPIRFLIAREHYESKLMGWLYKIAKCIPVDRSGNPEKALRQALRSLNEGDVIALFPHGTIHLDNDPPRKLKGGFAKLASWSNAPVFPVRIDGVTAQGKVLIAPFIPSHVHLTFGSVLLTDQLETQQLIQLVTNLIAPAKP
jgi:1-acyl-sn-glycerol-3-phosphate acyltransferase